VTGVVVCSKLLDDAIDDNEEVVSQPALPLPLDSVTIEHWSSFSDDAFLASCVMDCSFNSWFRTSDSSELKLDDVSHDAGQGIVISTDISKGLESSRVEAESD
jgi:hypothetical protein